LRYRQCAEKAAIYAEAGVREYWIVVPDQRAVDVHADPAGDAYRRKARRVSPDEVRVESIPGIKLDLGWIFD
jgi:Uma2 family endonuclease